jgi:two-component sensor histidine kinase
MLIENILLRDSLFLLQNTISEAVFILSYLLLRRGRYDSTVLLLFGPGLLVVQLSFLAGDFLGNPGRPGSLVDFAVVNACVTVLVASVFIRKNRRLLLVVLPVGFVLAFHLTTRYAQETHPSSHLIGLFAYYAVAVIFAFLIRSIIKKIAELLQERELLLRVVHHRIKNHMYTIASILSLQAMEFSEPKVKEAFEETRWRIRLMQEIYETLYAQQADGDIELRPLLEHLQANLGEVFCRGKDAWLLFEIEDLRCSSRLAFAVGIIVNELVTNSLKYAFEELDLQKTVKEKKKQVQVEVHKGRDEKIRILVADNGCGVRDEIIKGSHQGFGLTMVRGYVR